MNVRAFAPTMVVAAALLLAQGCQLPAILSAVGHNIEREKKIEVLAKYDDLVNRSVAVLVHADMSMLYEYPMVKPNLSANIAARVQQNVSGARVLSPPQLMSWEYQTPTWGSMPMGSVMEALDVQRIVYVDVVEFRLNPQGNRWLWEGAVVANIAIFERDSLDPDAPMEEYSVTAKYPQEENVMRDQLTPTQMEAGLVGTFSQKVAWLFYDHIEDKYPDRPMK